jgi:uncharacterized protein
MKTSLSYLPQDKQDQILQITEVIKEVINPEKIILFGSYAKGTQVEDTYFERGIRYEYISDYDFLIVPQKNVVQEFLVQDSIQNRFHFRTPINVIVHSIKYVNEGLSEGQYFFTDIINEGILLYDTGNFDFDITRHLTTAEQKEISQRYFDQYFPSGIDFLEMAVFGLEKNKLKSTAFVLHQAAENFYNAMLLVFTGYKPKTHNLDKLRKYAKPLSEDLFKIFPFPEKDETDKNLFDILKRGYIDARYKEDFTVNINDLKQIIDKLHQIKGIVKDCCQTKIEEFRAN